MKILFVCTGNTCRSPMAQTMFNQAASEGITADSAGIFAVFGSPASSAALEVMQERGFDLSIHSSKPLTSKLIFENDLILTMEIHHAEALKKSYSEFEDKIFTLKGYTDGEDADISDPFGEGLEAYGHCADEIQAAVDKLLQRLGDNND